MGFTERMAATAKRMIDTYGAAATLVTSGTAIYNPATGFNIATGMSTRAVQVVIEAKRRRYMNGDTVEQGDLVATICADFTPAPGDRLRLGGDTYLVQDVKATYAGSAAVLYELTVKKA